jgi:hypothetical protein
MVVDPHHYPGFQYIYMLRILLYFAGCRLKRSRLNAIIIQQKVVTTHFQIPTIQQTNYY